MSVESRRNREAARSHEVRMRDPASRPLKKTPERESHESVSRYSERSLHSPYEIREVSCKVCLERVPYASLLGCAAGIAGIVMFLLTKKKIITLTTVMAREAFKRQKIVLSDKDQMALALEVSFIVLSVLVLFAGILATGDTRARLFGSEKARFCGRILCVILILASLALIVLWLMLAKFYIRFYTIIQHAKLECSLYVNRFFMKRCLYLSVVNILFDDDKKVDYELCDENTIKIYCKDFAEKVAPAFNMLLYGPLLVVLALAIYCGSLAANYAKIRSQAKFQVLEDLRSLELDISSSKDRF